MRFYCSNGAAGPRVPALALRKTPFGHKLLEPL